MDFEKIGHFIRKMREEKKWTQETLANKLYCERTKINKIENGKRYIKLDDLLLLCEIFEISLDELIAGEMKNNINKQKVEITFKEYLKSQNYKLKRMKLIIFLLLMLFICLFTIFTIMYFFQNYKSVRIYNFSGNSENYEITDGLLFLSKEKIFLKIDNIIPSVDKISIYSELNGNKILIYSGDSDVILNDSYGYSSFISYKDFIKSNQKIFVVINGERVDLNFRENFVNSGIFYSKKDNIGESIIDKISIPKKIQDSFQCKNESCYLNLNGESLLFNNEIFSVVKNDNYYSYDLRNNIFEYQNTKNAKSDFILLVTDNNITCISGNCKNSKKIYDTFYNLYLLKYLK